MYDPPRRSAEGGVALIGEFTEVRQHALNEYWQEREPPKVANRGLAGCRYRDDVTT